MDAFIFKTMEARLKEKIGQSWRYLGAWGEAKLTNRQSKHRSQEVADVHYNLSNTMYEQMLGQSMAYTCGYWKDANTLDEAQYAKLRF